MINTLKTREWQVGFIILLAVIIATFGFAFALGYTSGDFSAAHESVMNSPIVKATTPIVMSGVWQAVVVIFLNNMLIITLTVAGAYFIGWKVIAFMPCVFQPAIAGYVSGSYSRLGAGLQGLQIVGTIGIVEFAVIAFAGSIGLVLVQNPDRKLAFQTLAVCGVTLLVAAIAEAMVFVK